MKSHNKAFTAERKKPRPLKSDVLGGYAAENRGADPRASQETQGACTLRPREAQ